MPVLELEERPQSLAHDRVVVDDQHPDQLAAPPGGRWCRRRARSGSRAVRRARGRAPPSRSGRAARAQHADALGIEARRRRRRPRRRTRRPRRSRLHRRRAGRSRAGARCAAPPARSAEQPAQSRSRPRRRSPSTSSSMLDAVHALEHLDLLAQRALEPVALELGRAQLEDQRRAARRAPRARALRTAVDLRARGVGIAVEQRRRRLGREHEAEQLLADDVVQLEREPVALRTTIESSRLRSYRRAFVIAIAACAASSSISSWSVSSKRGAALLLGQVEGADHALARDDRHAEERAHVRMAPGPPAAEPRVGRGCRRSVRHRSSRASRRASRACAAAGRVDAISSSLIPEMRKRRKPPSPSGMPSAA